ncbi:MAG: PilZ domain-containing protein [Deltaproteobacteria bacterium]|nr:PilZ domain-containing protein [Deltaproteobacteria bacterium]
MLFIGEEQLYSETRDLSAGGMFIATDVSLHANSVVKLSLRFDGAEKRGEYLAKVAHVRRDAAGGTIGAGLELVATTPESRLDWVRHLHWIQEHGAQPDQF